LAAHQLGHPLLPNDVRVCNDVELGPSGNVLIVTGSNMSGKSTMLRSLGLNVILAQMGNVVCATRMELCSVVLETSMRIDDSLAEGVSFFMAELRRLKEIVDRSLEIRAGRGRFLFLLDEILQGTNSRERHIAVCAVIQQLLDNGAFGAFTTHDLDLANVEGLRARSKTVYFTESFVAGPNGDVMTFDYRMYPGVAPSTNALKLLKIVGLASH
jgi:DNA mismatch repair ATPase MutS